MQSHRIAQISATALALVGSAVLVLSPHPSQPESYSAVAASSGSTYGGAYTVGNYDADILYARQSLDRYYGQSFNGYTAPGVSWINEAGGTATGCGTLSSTEGPRKAAFYCPNDKVVYLDYSFLQAINRQYGFEGILQVMSHEYGHHIQQLQGSTYQPHVAIFANQRKAREWQADCYSGGFTHWMTSVMPSISYSNLWNEVYDSGDNGIDDANGYSHGTGTQRTGWFANGWNATTATASNMCFTAMY
jgi:hypothetical protein